MDVHRNNISSNKFGEIPICLNHHMKALNARAKEYNAHF